MARFSALLLVAAASADDPRYCTSHEENFAPCYKSGCCESDNYGCFKRPDRNYAQCRSLASQADEDGTCTDTAEWLCPASWMNKVPKDAPPASDICTAPTDPHGGCYRSHCCRQPETYGCFKRPDRAYAQCRPYEPQLGADGACTDSDQWLCPLSWMSHIPAPMAALQEGSKQLEVCGSPVRAYGACFAHGERCCADGGFVCAKR
jgi:hypothetical protein